jgi:hypothetical protein
VNDAGPGSPASIPTANAKQSCRDGAAFFKQNIYLQLVKPVLDIHLRDVGNGFSFARGGHGRFAGFPVGLGGQDFFVDFAKII